MQQAAVIVKDAPVTEHSAPVSPTQRVQAIDVLRGLALFGVLMVNLVTEFRVSVFQQFLPPDPAMPWIDRLAETFVTAVLELKAISLFSLLFGVGMAIQFEHLQDDPSRLPLLVRRVCVLLVFGVIHMCLIWNGDILTEYALVGMLAIPFLYFPNRALCAAALGLVVLFVSLSLLLPQGYWPTTALLQQQVADANRIYANGGYGDVLRFRVQEIPVLLPLLAYIAPRTLALFLAGILVWRSGVLRHPDRYKPWLLCTTVSGLSLGAVLTFMDGSGRALVSAEYQPWLTLVAPLGPIALASGYASVLLLLLGFTRARKVLGIFAPLGRMAFTSYICQSLVFGWLFYGYGLGWFGRLGAARTLVLGLAVYIAQIIVSEWWLRRFRFGPIEWLWRTLMYGVRQPMRLRKS
ncbi:DUF418 domain-containing protein [Dyella sp. EPa41]|uniref:DUF418 domain-containing protein n=1 Tax=Dyella sp. EPa41 TaxID=1561194 RepID=UPI001916791A|nr:DUF418 domain-containing protein [Dyella sp. EPa41]